MKSKTSLIGFLMMILCVFFCSCDIDPYEGRRPDDYPNSKWYCSEYNITFLVGSERNVTLLVADDEIPFSRLFAEFDNEVTLRFTINGEEYLRHGLCKFGRKKFSVSLENVQDVFGEENITLVFERIE